MTSQPPEVMDELQRAVSLFVWGFEFYAALLRRHHGAPRLLFFHLLPISRTTRRSSAVPAIGVRTHSFHGAGLRLEDEHGLVFDADFDWATGIHLGWLDPWKFWYFVQSLPCGLEAFRADARPLPSEDDDICVIGMDGEEVCVVGVDGIRRFLSTGALLDSSPHPTDEANRARDTSLREAFDKEKVLRDALEEALRDVSAEWLEQVMREARAAFP